MDQIYSGINNQNINPQDEELKTNEEIYFTTYYDEIFSFILDLMSTSIHVLVSPEDNQQRYPHVAEIQKAIQRAERDTEIAKQTFDRNYLNTNQQLKKILMLTTMEVLTRRKLS